MKLRLAGPVKKLNVQHRTSNIERRILMTLRFIYFKTSESRQRRDLKAAEFCWVDSLCSVFFLNWQNTLFDVGRSMFDVHFLVSPLYETTLPKFLFRLDRPFFWPAAGLKPDT